MELINYIVIFTKSIYTIILKLLCPRNKNLKYGIYDYDLNQNFLDDIESNIEMR